MRNLLSILSVFGILLFSFGCERAKTITGNASEIRNVQKVDQKDLFPDEPELITDNSIEINEIIPEIVEEVIEEKIPAKSSEKLTFTSGLSFPECKSRWQFKSSDWYENFRDKVTDLDGVGEKNIAIICESADKEVVLAMLNGNIQETGGVVRYRVKANVLEKANVTQDIALHLHQFKGRFENIIPMIGGLREDNGCEHSFRLNYDFLVNEITPLVQCTNCRGEAELCKSL